LCNERKLFQLSEEHQITLIRVSNVDRLKDQLFRELIELKTKNDVDTLVCLLTEEELTALGLERIFDAVFGVGLKILFFPLSAFSSENVATARF